jgi:hypothetical protein
VYVATNIFSQEMIVKLKLEYTKEKFSPEGVAIGVSFEVTQKSFTYFEVHLSLLSTSYLFFCCQALCITLNKLRFLADQCVLKFLTT